MPGAQGDGGKTPGDRGHNARWSSLEARQVHTLEAAGSNPAFAINLLLKGTCREMGAFLLPNFGVR